MATAHKRSTLTDRLFRAAVVLKGLDGGSQLLTGLVLLFVPARTIADLARFLVTRDLAGKPTGALATHLQAAAQGFTTGGTHTFVILYLLAHGVIKLGLVVALLRRIMPAYPVAMAALALFVGFELLRAVRTHSLALPFFAALDILIIGVVLKEYRRLRRERSTTTDKLADESPTG